MRGRTPVEAVNSYLALIQLAVSCASDAVVTVRGGYYPSESSHALTMYENRPVRLGGASRLWFQLRQYYRIVESDLPSDSWMVQETGYRYAVIDTEGREVLEYHWHPVGESPIVTPHLHIGHGAMAARRELSDTHLPTGLVSISEILRMLIRDFSVTPRREDWESVLNEVSASDSG